MMNGLGGPAKPAFAGFGQGGLGFAQQQDNLLNKLK